MPTGTIFVYPEEVTERGTALYARVSSADQKSDLDRQSGEAALAASGRRLVVMDPRRDEG